AGPGGSTVPAGPRGSRRPVPAGLRGSRRPVPAGPRGSSSRVPAGSRGSRALGTGRVPELLRHGAEPGGAQGDPDPAGGPAAGTSVDGQLGTGHAAPAPTEPGGAGLPRPQHDVGPGPVRRA